MKGRNVVCKTLFFNQLKKTLCTEKKVQIPTRRHMRYENPEWGLPDSGEG